MRETHINEMLKDLHEYACNIDVNSDRVAAALERISEYLCSIDFNAKRVVDDIDRITAAMKQK